MTVGARLAIIGVGNEFRRDDGVGPAVIARLRERAVGRSLPAGVVLSSSDGDPGRLMGLWEGAGLAVVVDAARTHPGRPGRVHRLELQECGPWRTGASSTHGFGLREAVELARSLGRLPRRLIVYGVEGFDGTLGTGLTEAVAAAVARLAEHIEAEVNGAARRGGVAIDGSRRPAWPGASPPPRTH